MNATKNEWYKEAPKKLNRTWTAQERKFIYTMRKKKIPVAQIIAAFPDEVTATQIHNQARIAKRSDFGLCYKCGRPMTIKDKRSRKKTKLNICTECRTSVRAYQKKLRENALKMGLCGYCLKRVVVPGKTACKHCLSSTHRRRVAKGLCGSCGKNTINRGRSDVLCTTCLDKNAVYSAIR